MIDREDMLELTRRMTPSRHCFDRAAGAYMDGDGFIDGSFNIHFGKLNPAETAKNLKLAKTVPFSGTNRNLKEYKVPGKSETSKKMLQLLCALKDCALKNDALVSVAVPRNSLLIQGQGGNAGGPVTTIGYNLLDSISKGIIQ